VTEWASARSGMSVRCDSDTDESGGRRWLYIPAMSNKRGISLAAGVFLVLAATAAVWVLGTHHDEDTRHWQSGITQGSRHLLHMQGWKFQPADASHTPISEGAAVDHANAQDRIGGQLIRVTFARVVPPDTSEDPAPGQVWVIEYGGVRVPPLGGADSPGEHSGTEVVLIDADTGRTRFAITG
jgi:hypothetical protein